MGANPTQQLFASVGSNRSCCGGDKAAEVFDVKGDYRRFREYAGRNVSKF